MRKLISLGLIVLVVGLASSFGRADTGHPMTVHLANDVVSITLFNGTNGVSLALTTDELLNGINEKESSDSVSFLVWSLKSCSVLASASDFAPDFPISHLQLKVNRLYSPGSYRSLTTTPMAVAHYPNGSLQNVFQTVNFKLVNLQNLNATAGTYNTVVTYTVVTPAIGD